MADQKTVVNFREQSRDALAYAMADRMDQLAFLTLSGVAYTTRRTALCVPRLLQLVTSWLILSSRLTYLRLLAIVTCVVDYQALQHLLLVTLLLLQRLTRSLQAHC